MNLINDSEGTTVFLLSGPPTGEASFLLILVTDIKLSMQLPKTSSRLVPYMIKAAISKCSLTIISYYILALRCSLRGEHDFISWIITMFMPIFIASIIASINAASMVSRSQSYPLPQPRVLGPKARITIGNKIIAPDGFERS